MMITVKLEYRSPSPLGARNPAPRTSNLGFAPDFIAAQFRESWARAHVVITTCGLGPTCDDRTRDAVAAVLGCRLVHDPAVEAAISKRNMAQIWEYLPLLRGQVDLLKWCKCCLFIKPGLDV
ncbi:MAG: hypothetical protein FJ392_05100 [Verrucomicrobia bacterium]|nr:hypothetical protein [Verrucomicrobiota bacterium]